MTTTKIGGKRKGAGRPKGSTKAEGMTTKVVRVSAELSKEQLDSLPGLLAVIEYWEEECIANPDSARHYWLKKALEDMRATGF